MKARDLLGLDTICGGDRAKEVKAIRALAISGMAGVVLGVVGGALIWPAHRVAGALLGGLIVGPTLGYGVGMIVASNYVADDQSDLKQKMLPPASARVVGEADPFAHIVGELT